MSLFCLKKITSKQHDQISVYIEWNDVIFAVYLSKAPSAASAIENTLIERYNDSSNPRNANIWDEILETIVDVGSDLFNKVAPPKSVAGEPPLQDLHTHFFPKEDAFTFRTMDGNPEMVQKDGHRTTENEVLLDRDDQPFRLHRPRNCNLPTFSTKDIEMLGHLNAGYIAHVKADGNEMCSRAGDNKGEEAAQRELDSLWKIARSPYARSIRVPKLLGLIHTPGNNEVVGILQEYIPVSRLATLASLRVSMIESSRRMKWARQVKEAVKLLHQIGVAWGGCTPFNVLVHGETDDAWIIDFQNLTGTVPGDKAAVKKIYEYLRLPK